MVQASVRASSPKPPHSTFKPLCVLLCIGRSVSLGSAVGTDAVRVWMPDHFHLFLTSMSRARFSAGSRCH